MVTVERGFTQVSGYTRKLCREIYQDGLLEYHELFSQKCNKRLSYHALNKKGYLLYINLLILRNMKSVPEGKLEIEADEEEIKIQIKFAMHDY